MDVNVCVPNFFKLIQTCQIWHRSELKIQENQFNWCNIWDLLDSIEFMQHLWDMSSLFTDEHVHSILGCAAWCTFLHRSKKKINVWGEKKPMVWNSMSKFHNQYIYITNGLCIICRVSCIMVYDHQYELYKLYINDWNRIRSHRKRVWKGCSYSKKPRRHSRICVKSP